MKSRETLVQVGCFAFAGLLVLAGVTLALVKFWKPRLYYPVLYRDVSVSLGPGSLVLFHGEQIGEVVGREFWEHDGQANVLITIAVEPAWSDHIRRNLLATIEENFVTGVQNINLRIRPPSQQVSAGGFLEPTPFASLEDAMLNAWKIEPLDEKMPADDPRRQEMVSYVEGEPSPFERIRAQANELQGVMSSIRQTADRLQTATDKLESQLSQGIQILKESGERITLSLEKAVARVDTAGESFQKACDRLVGMMDENKGAFESIARNLNETLAPDGELRTLMRNTDANFNRMLSAEGDLAKLLRSAEETFQKVGTTLSPDGEFFRLTHTASQTLRSVGEVAGDLHVVLSSQEADLSDSLAQLRYSVLGLRKFMEEIERDPSSLLLGPRQPGTAEESFDFRRRDR